MPLPWSSLLWSCPLPKTKYFFQNNPCSTWHPSSFSAPSPLPWEDPVPSSRQLSYLGSQRRSLPTAWSVLQWQPALPWALAGSAESPVPVPTHIQNQPWPDTVKRSWQGQTEGCSGAPHPSLSTELRLTRWGCTRSPEMAPAGSPLFPTTL